MIENLDQANQLIQYNCRLTFASSTYDNKSFRLNPKETFIANREKKLYYLFHKTFKYGEKILNLDQKECLYGWEFKVYLRKDHVEKIPNGIFFEINTYEYISNIEKNYNLLLKYLDKDFIAKTEFNNKQNIIYQELGQNINYIEFNNKILIKELIKIVQLLEPLLLKVKWMPDISISFDWDIKRVYLKNFLYINNKIKINDFSYIYDPFRIHPKFTDTIVLDREKIILYIKKRV